MADVFVFIGTHAFIALRSIQVKAIHNGTYLYDEKKRAYYHIAEKHEVRESEKINIQRYYLV